MWAGFLSCLQNTFGAQDVPAETWMLWMVVAIVATLVATPVWTHVRQIVTVVHELGTQLLVSSCGRRFTGFVINGICLDTR